MIRDDKAVMAFERLAEALSADILCAEDADVLESHAGQAARVAADTVRQSVRRGGARAPEVRDLPRDIVQPLTMCSPREQKR